MRKNRKSKKKYRQVLLSIFGALVVGYFMYHTLQGDRGWFAMLRMQHEVTKAEKTLTELHSERDELQQKTQLLRGDSLDPDLLDEKSRELLNYSKPNEIIILTTPNSDKAH